MDCAICLEVFDNSAFALFCGHMFHRGCIENLPIIRRSYTVACPLCRQLCLSVFDGESVREIFFNSATTTAAASTDAADSQAHRQLQQALNDNKAMTANLARVREDHTVLRNLLMDIQRMDAEQTSELRASKAREETARKERDDALAELAKVKAEKAELAARVALLDQQKTEMARKIEQYSKLEDSLSSTMELFRNISGKDIKSEDTNSVAGTNTASTGCSALTSVATAQVTVDQTPPAVYEEINVMSRHGRTSQRRDVLPIRVAPATAAPAVLTMPASPAPKKKRELKTGSAILWTGYGCPRYTPVKECVATDGYHHFSGKGTNQHRKRYTCMVMGCGVVVSE